MFDHFVGLALKGIRFSKTIFGLFVMKVFLCFFVCRLWDMSSKQLLEKTIFQQTTRSVAFSSDGMHLAVGHGDGSFRVLKGRSVIQ